MLGKILMVACATFGLVAGSCVDFLSSQKFCPSVISVPVSKTCFAEPMASEGCSSNAVLTAPVVSENVYAPVMTASVPEVMSAPSSDDCFSSGSSSQALSLGESSFSGGMVMGAESGTGAIELAESSAYPVIQSPPVTLPTVESPMITLSSPAVPAPRVIASRCVCTKTVVKPQIFQRVVTVPRIQRYLKRTVTPVVENLVYKSRPVSVSSGSSVLSSGSSYGSMSSPVVVSGSSNPVLLSESTPYSRIC